MGLQGRRVVVIGYEIPTDLAVERYVVNRDGAQLVDLRSFEPEQVVDQLAAADAILTEGSTPLRRAVIERLDATVAISVAAVGTDGVDVDAATDRGIVVTNVSDYCVHEVADHTVALLLAAWRRLRAAERVARGGAWAIDSLRPIQRLRGRTCGLLGFGRIARQVAMRMNGFGVDLIAHDPAIVEAPPDEAAFVRLVDREELLRRSDLLSLHVPLTSTTAGIIDAAALALLPPGAVVVNCGRGGLVVLEDLLRTLESGHLAGVALDVFEAEPAPADHPLLARDDVICTPHMAYYSEQALLQLRRQAAQNAVDVMRGGPAAVLNPQALPRRLRGAPGQRDTLAGP